MRVGLDTNLLVYAVDSSGDKAKHALALRLVGQVANGGVLSMQALTELYAVLTRKGIASASRAQAHVGAWRRAFTIATPISSDLDDAMRVHDDHGIPFWDAMMWATLRRAGAQILLTEDLQDGRELEGVLILNPFNPANDIRIGEILGAPGSSS